MAGLQFVKWYDEKGRLDRESFLVSCLIVSFRLFIH